MLIIGVKEEKPTQVGFIETVPSNQAQAKTQPCVCRGAVPLRGPVLGAWMELSSKGF